MKREFLKRYLLQIKAGKHPCTPFPLPHTISEHIIKPQYPA
jgi:hypothetical protein